MLRRSPLGLRGLKYFLLCAYYTTILSQPSWAAWIEITMLQCKSILTLRRSPLGLRGLKYFTNKFLNPETGRSPLGLRGLKLIGSVLNSGHLLVAALLGCVD